MSLFISIRCSALTAVSDFSATFRTVNFSTCALGSQAPLTNNLTFNCGGLCPRTNHGVCNACVDAVDPQPFMIVLQGLLVGGYTVGAVAISGRRSQG